MVASDISYIVSPMVGYKILKMNRVLLQAIKIVFTIIAIIMIIISIVMIFLKLTGHSPTETTITFSIIGILLTLQIVIITILFQLKEDVGCFKEFKRQTIEKISKIEKKM